MSLYDGSHHLTLRIFQDFGDFIEVQTELVADGWGGRTTAYTTLDELARFASELDRFNKELSGEAAFDIGADNGTGLIAMRFHTLDRSRHLACHCRLARSGVSGSRPDEIYKLAIQITTEPHFIGEFVTSLGRLAKSETGAAVLVIE